jgi:hypothetical protein
MNVSEVVSALQGLGATFATELYSKHLQKGLSPKVRPLADLVFTEEDDRLIFTAAPAQDDAKKLTFGQLSLIDENLLKRETDVSLDDPSKQKVAVSLLYPVKQVEYRDGKAFVITAKDIAL